MQNDISNPQPLTGLRVAKDARSGSGMTESSLTYWKRKDGNFNVCDENRLFGVKSLDYKKKKLTFFFFL